MPRFHCFGFPRFNLKDPDVNRLLQEAPEGTVVADIGLKEGDKLDMVQTIRVKVVGPLADDYKGLLTSVSFSYMITVKGTVPKKSCKLLMIMIMKSAKQVCGKSNRK